MTSVYREWHKRIENDVSVSRITSAFLDWFCFDADLVLTRCQIVLSWWLFGPVVTVLSCAAGRFLFPAASLHPHGSSLLVSLTSFLPFPNFFDPTFFKMRPYISISLKIWHFVVQKGWNDSVRSGRLAGPMVVRKRVSPDRRVLKKKSGRRLVTCVLVLRSYQIFFSGLTEREKNVHRPKSCVDYCSIFSSRPNCLNRIWRVYVGKGPSSPLVYVQATQRGQ